LHTAALKKSSITSVHDLSTANNISISLNIKPNPANDYFEIDLATQDYKNSEISIYSSDGKIIVKINSPTTNSIIYNTNNLAIGEYNVILTSGYEKALQRLVVVR
jgi:hypothetical protein